MMHISRVKYESWPPVQLQLRPIRVPIAIPVSPPIQLSMGIFRGWVSQSPLTLPSKHLHSQSLPLTVVLENIMPKEFGFCCAGTRLRETSRPGISKAG